MTYKQILHYISHTPHNTNRAILRQLVEEFVEFHGGNINAKGMLEGEITIDKVLDYIMQNPYGANLEVLHQNFEKVVETYGGVYIPERDEGTYGFPIAWNTIKVANNASFTVSHMNNVKVSSYIPTEEELMNSQLTIDGISARCNYAIPFGEVIYANFQVNDINLNVYSCSSAGEHAIGDDPINVPESGFYVINYGLNEKNFDAVISLVE